MFTVCNEVNKKSTLNCLSLKSIFLHYRILKQDEVLPLEGGFRRVLTIITVNSHLILLNIVKKYYK